MARKHRECECGHRIVVPDPSLLHIDLDIPCSEPESFGVRRVVKTLPENHYHPCIGDGGV